MNIIQAIRDPNLFGPFFDNDLTSWKRWLVILKAIWGIPIKSEFGRKVVREVCNRDARKLNPAGYQCSLLICGRRSGKSRASAICSGFAATLAGLEKNLSPGEQGLVAVVAPTRKQGRIVRGYIRSLFDVPLLKQEIVSDRQQDAFQLKNGNRLEILSSDYRAVRGWSLLSCIVDEICFMGLDSSSRVRTDTQLVQSLQPALATTNGKLIAISSPYGKVGWAYKTWERHFGNDNSQDTLVVNARSKYLNPGLSQKFLDQRKAEDLSSYLSEFEACWKEDVGIFIDIEVIKALVVKGRRELLAREGNRYFAFVDLSGGRGDASALAIAHKENKKIVLDVLDYHPSPNNPYQVCASMCERLKDWRIRKVVGDNFSPGFTENAFRDKGIVYSKCELNASALYQNLLPILCAGDIELLDNDHLIKQLASLERRTRSGGKDVITHPPRSNDDLANAVAGVAFCCSKKLLVVGAAGF